MIAFMLVYDESDREWDLYLWGEYLLTASTEKEGHELIHSIIYACQETYETAMYLLEPLNFNQDINQKLFTTFSPVQQEQMS